MSPPYPDASLARGIILGVPAKFQVGDQVLVPAVRLTNPEQQIHALVVRTVLSQLERSVIVDDNTYGTVKIASRLVHSRNMGFVVLQIGDLRTETALLNPLAKSILQFLRLLLPDDDVQSINIRTASELDSYWQSNHGVISHVVIIRHGTSDHISFVDIGPLRGRELADHFANLTSSVTPKIFISLACQTGRAAFARPFSEAAVCRELIAPFNSVHGAAARNSAKAF